MGRDYGFGSVSSAADGVWRAVSGLAVYFLLQPFERRSRAVRVCSVSIFRRIPQNMLGWCLGLSVRHARIQSHPLQALHPTRCDLWLALASQCRVAPESVSQLTAAA